MLEIYQTLRNMQTYLYYTGMSDADGTSPKTDWRDPALANAWGQANLESAIDYKRRAEKLAS